MDLLAQRHPARFQEVHNAYTVALELPRWRDAPVRVGVCASDGEVVATGEFQDHRQARLFTIQMNALGYEECDGSGHGCDRVYVPCEWAARMHREPHALETH